MDGLSDDDLQRLYAWVDEVPLSRPKRNIARDFSDGVLTAEVIAHFIPRLVEIHNYSSANSSHQKLYNWNTLNGRVLKKFGMQIPQEDLNKIINCEPGAIEATLFKIQQKIIQYLARKQTRGQKPSRSKQPQARQSGSVQNGEIGSQSNGMGGNQIDALTDPRGSDQNHNLQTEVDQELLLEREQTIQELRETIGILELKVAKLEQLVRLKDTKISKLQDQISQQPR
mmetsp:Transcript_22550/g.29516  ORF Transcript_22550/g.29516 Transcript_22550/m.29516 type:complete len:227 (+) Transcript_22550:65-745(+)